MTKDYQTSCVSIARTGTKPIVFAVFIVLLGLPLLATTLSSPEWTKIKLRFIGEYVPKRITFRDKRLVQKRLVGVVESQHFRKSKFKVTFASLSLTF